MWIHVQPSCTVLRCAQSKSNADWLRGIASTTASEAAGGAATVSAATCCAGLLPINVQQLGLGAVMNGDRRLRLEKLSSAGNRPERCRRCSVHSQRESESRLAWIAYVSILNQNGLFLQFKVSGKYTRVSRLKQCDLLCHQSSKGVVLRYCSHLLFVHLARHWSLPKRTMTHDQALRMFIGYDFQRITADMCKPGTRALITGRP